MQIEVAGEAFYIDNIRKIMEARLRRPISEDGDEIDGLVCYLNHDRHNRHDRNAVKVTIDGEQVGHLPREIAAETVSQLRRRFFRKARTGVGEARIWARADGNFIGARITILV